MLNVIVVFACREAKKVTSTDRWLPLGPAVVPAAAAAPGHPEPCG